MRSHPLVGSFFVVVGVGLFGAGVFGSWVPPNIPGPLPAWVLIPLVLFQLGVWAILLGLFFLRSRVRAAPRQPRFAV